MASRATEVDFELSRPLTWAEREAFSASMRDDEYIKGHRFYEDAFRVVIYTSEDSRVLFSRFHSYLSLAFVNVYITAAKTIYPRVKV
jgi:hypothetical protein